MKKKSLLTSIALIIGLGFYTFLNSSYSGGFSSYSNTTCQTCHSNNAPATSITINGLPTFYTLGQAYPLSVTVTNTSKLIAGFQIRSNIGTISTTDPSISIYNDNRSAGHNSPKAMASGVATFNVTWTAPTTGNSAANFGAQGIGADGTGSTNNDSGVFTTVSNIALPARFIDFKATIKEDNVALQFTTSEEENIEQFEIEKSTDGKEFSFLEKHNPQGNTTYKSTDNNVEAGKTYYYRVKETSIDKKESFSETISIRMNASNSLEIYPTLVDNKILYIKGLQAELDYTFTLTSIVGTKIMSLKNVQNELSLSSVLPGIYMATVTNSNGLVKTEKILIR